MKWPDPTPGLVIRYAYLWEREYRAGLEEGLKDRPCAIVAAVKNDADVIRVVVLPVTHSTPDHLTPALEIPPRVKKRLMLDTARSWVILHETNVFVWPGPDLRPLANQ